MFSLECMVCTIKYNEASLSAVWIYDRCIILHWICTALTRKYFTVLSSCITMIGITSYNSIWKPIIRLKNLTPSSTFSSMAVDPMRRSESLSQMSMCMEWRARYRRNQRFSPGLRKLSSTLNCSCRPGDAVQRMRGLITTVKTVCHSQCFIINTKHANVKLNNTQVSHYFLKALEPFTINGHNTVLKCSNRT